MAELTPFQRATARAKVMPLLERIDAATDVDTARVAIVRLLELIGADSDPRFLLDTAIGYLTPSSKPIAQ